MKEIILVNHARLQRSAVYEVIKVEKVEQRLIPVSRITEVTALERSIKKDVMDEEVQKQVKKMSLDDELGGSIIIYLDASGDAKYATVLETPEAIYKQIYSE